MPSIDSKVIAKNATQSFVLPDMCIRIRNMLDDHHSTMADIGNVLSLDPSLSSKLLKLANSPLFRFESQIATIGKAVNLIGGEALYNLMMAETASSAFEHFNSDAIDLKKFWRHSIYCSLVAKHLAKIARIRGSERFFLLGLLHNMGELIVAVQAPQEAIKCNQYDKRTLPWKLQYKVLGFHYTQCSAELLSQWRLPEQLYYPIFHLHDEKKALKSKEIGIVYTAFRAAIAMTNGGLYSVSQLVSPKVLKSLKLDQNDLADALKFASMEADNMLAIMIPRLSYERR
ncbi:MAG: HD-like signal output (HDOD) protein [Paraglaciecola sp.]|jgi:HD-like signal output (HDOD) protein